MLDLSIGVLIIKDSNAGYCGMLHFQETYYHICNVGSESHDWHCWHVSVYLLAQGPMLASVQSFALYFVNMSQ